MEYTLHSSSQIPIQTALNEIVVELSPDVRFYLIFSLLCQAGRHLHIWLALLPIDYEMLTKDQRQPNPTTASMTRVYLR